MRSIVRRLALLAIVPAAFLGVVAVASPAQAAAPTVAQLQNDILRSSNIIRAKYGCGALRADAKLGYAARGQSGYMARTGRFGHTGYNGSTFITRARAAGYTAPLSENIAWGYRSGIEVVNAWLKSPGHRANLLNCKAKAVGVGAIYASNGTPYYTQMFGSR